MAETIYVNVRIKTDLDRSNDGYDEFLNGIRTSWAYMTRNNEPLFTTDAENL